jgi:hypothetical protein
MKNGKPLNLNFETGDLSDWTATGDAFASPLINADPSPIHDKDMTIGFEGKNFLSSGGTVNYKLTGTLTSVPFAVTQPYASFMVSGGALQDTRVEIVLADTKKVVFQSTGQGRANLQPVVVDLRKYLNKNIFVRIIDKETGTFRTINWLILILIIFYFILHAQIFKTNYFKKILLFYHHSTPLSMLAFQELRPQKP